jgi:hypothetical protein
MPDDREGFGGDIQEDPVTNTYRLLEVRTPPDADVIVMQRLTYTYLAQAIPMMRARGIAVVVDMDDDLSCIHPDNVAFSVMHPRMGDPRHSWHHAAKACQEATLVTVTSPALLKTYAGHGRGVILPNCVPASYLQVPHHDSDVIGWGGSTHSHPDDLQVTGTAIARLLRETGARFRAVGNGLGIRSALQLDDEPEATGHLDLEAWPAALATIGVGIAPLADTRFNTAKSYLKPLEMSAVGVPWVASPRAEYRALHESTGLGLLAAKPQQWYSRLKRLRDNPGLRQEMSEHGRAVVRERHTIEGQAWRWWEAWESALRTQRQNAALFSRV